MRKATYSIGGYHLLAIHITASELRNKLLMHLSEYLATIPSINIAYVSCKSWVLIYFGMHTHLGGV